MNKLKLLYENGDVQELDADPDGLLVLHDPANTFVTGSASLNGVTGLELVPEAALPEPEPEPVPEVGPNATEAAVAVALANEIDIDTVVGSGPDGQVTANDVEAVATERHLAKQQAEAGGTAESSAAPPKPRPRKAKPKPS